MSISLAFAGINATAPPLRKVVAATAERLLLKTVSIDGNDGVGSGVVERTSISAFPRLPGSVDTSNGDAAAKSCGRLIATATPPALPLTGSYINWSKPLGAPRKLISTPGSITLLRPLTISAPSSARPFQTLASLSYVNVMRFS